MVLPLSIPKSVIKKMHIAIQHIRTHSQVQLESIAKEKHNYTETDDDDSVALDDMDYAN
jgi:hypothetical protein